MECPRHPLAVVIDIDGVIIQHKQKLEGATEAIERLQQDKVPFLFFTNNTAKNEQAKADQITQLLGLKQPISREQVVLNYTPVKSAFASWHDKVVLFIGREQIDQLLPFEQIPYYVTIDEYCTIFPQCVPFSKRPTEKIAEVSERVKKRLGLEQLRMDQLKFDLIFTLNSPTRWEQCIQVILDVLSTDDGRVSQQNEYRHHDTHIPVYTALNDLWFRRKDHPLPRLLVKPFNMALEAIYRQIFQAELQLIHYGKPTRKAFEFVHRHMQRVFGPAAEYIMIGDNIDTDIEGAFNYGWKSVLVTSGVSKHSTTMANYMCKNVQQAVEWCLSERTQSIPE